MVVTRAGANKQMEDELPAIKSKLEDLDQKFLGLNHQYSPMDNRHQLESSADTGFSVFSHYRGLKLDFPRFIGDDPTGWIVGKNNILVYITLLISIKSPLHPFIRNMKHLNGYVGTSRLMPSQTGQIFPNSSCSDLVLVLLMTSQEHSLNFTKLALWGIIIHNLRN